ncbi:cold-shock protein [Paenibacillus sp. OAS669]|uniref:cold-shock protein n=1 Tax=Paenibacillus sp. OAS669 TaxID=2663821 RepID=UPI00178BE002|nr:cold shock domain-containing protein [Paenibacillus sp. OAS669]MBE1443893.1 CspA family cold shock protein [Paenibacillus sp. OAS669]
MTHKGTVKWFSDERGYGIIAGSDGKDAFVHQSVIKMDGFRKLEQGQTVAYDLEKTERGLRATNVYVIHEG